MKCFTENCPQVLPVHGRRIYCANCRAMMNKWAKRRPAEVIDYAKRVSRTAFRLEHIAERRLDAPVAKATIRKNGRGRPRTAGDDDE